MCVHRVSSVPTELIVADFFVYASVPFAEHCLKDTVAYTKGKKNASSGAQKRAEVLCHPCILEGTKTKGDKIRSGYLVPAFSKAEKRVEMLGVDSESPTPTQGAMQQSVDCESLTPTRGAAQQSVDCESLT